MIKILVTAPRGKMGRLIVQLAAENKNIQVVGGIAPKGRDYIGKDVGLVAGLDFELGAPVYDSLADVISLCDIIVDFSTRALSMEALALCKEVGKPFICGTTGFSKEEEALFHETAISLPVLKAANTSYMANIMRILSGMGAKFLGDSCNTEIIEYHDAKKVDKPSGTSKELREYIATESSRIQDEIPIHSIRAGDISSIHTVLMAGRGERLEITHTCQNWEGCALGVCSAIEYLYGKPAGYYTMDDVLEL